MILTSDFHMYVHTSTPKHGYFKKAKNKWLFSTLVEEENISSELLISFIWYDETKLNNQIISEFNKQVYAFEYFSPVINIYTYGNYILILHHFSCRL